MLQRNEVCNYNEEKLIAGMLAYPARNHAGHHYAQIHYGRSKRVVGHRMFAGSYLLHHEHGQSDEAESVAEIFSDET